MTPFIDPAQAALLASAHGSPLDMPSLLPWAETWQHWASRAFLDGYLEAMAGTNLLPAPASFDALLDAFITEKALYELEYELNNRPEWARIPLQALVTLALPLQR